MSSVNDNFRKKVEADYRGLSFGMDIPDETTASAIKMLKNENFEALQVRLHLYNSMCKLPRLNLREIVYFMRLQPSSVGNKSITYIVPNIYMDLLQRVVESGAAFSVEDWNGHVRSVDLLIESTPCLGNGMLTDRSEVVLTW